MKKIALRMANLVNANLDDMSITNKGYKDQFYEAMNVNGGEIDDATSMDYVTHLLAFPWKVCKYLKIP